MKEITELKEIQKIELDILKYVADFLEKNNLRYYLAYGTLLGAVRHKGFIPWDDDIDIHMPRPDYEKLIEIFNEQNKGSDYYLVSPYSKESKHFIAKIINTKTLKVEPFIKNDFEFGIDIDIFPLDAQTQDYAEFEKTYNKMKKVCSTYNILTQCKTLKRKVYRAVNFLKSRNKKVYQQKIDALVKNFNFDSSEYVGSISTSANSLGDRHKRTCFDKSIKLEFEGIFFNCPVGYDQVLTDVFGDYMQLPPESERITHHTNKTYWK